MRRMGILALALALPIETVTASDWQQIYIDSNTVVRAEVNSIKRSGQIVKVWTSWHFNAPISNPMGQYKSSRTLYLVNCTERQSATKQAAYFAGRELDSEVVFTSNVPDSKLEWSEVAPDSLGEVVLEFACGKVKPAS